MSKSDQDISRKEAREIFFFSVQHMENFRFRLNRVGQLPGDPHIQHAETDFIR